MDNVNLSSISKKISAQHEGDKKQLEVIFSSNSRVIVEAPAGYGKTTTMISRIAYLFATGGIPNPKRILGLTFSVNAALKVKRDVAERLPMLLGVQNSPILLGEKVIVTNYHGFCKSVLKKYGYLIADALRKDINLFRAIGELQNDQDNITKEWEKIADTLMTEERDTIVRVDRDIKFGISPVSKDIKAYNDIISRKLMPLNFITHNAVILLVLEIFQRYTEVKRFYQSFYPLIVVDEFQDTNCIAWMLLKDLISEDTQLLFLGDPLQRIYGFIGALPNIMDTAKDDYHMEKVILLKNYRFRNNPDMLKLDKNIRKNAADCFAPNISEDEMALLPAFWGATQQEEAQLVVTNVRSLLDGNPDRIALLFRGRNENVKVIEEELITQKIAYFYGMFSDDDIEYVAFHNKCQELFIEKFAKTKNVNKRSLSKFSESIKTVYFENGEKTINSMLILLDALIEKVAVDYADLGSEDKYDLLLDIFENHQLKQAMEYVDSQVILSTVHGSKGLEWDYIFLVDMERWIFPGYHICINCPNKFDRPTDYRCSLNTPLAEQFQERALDELSVFYVGITRARKQAFVSASAKRLNNKEEKYSVFSCMVTINGVELDCTTHFQFST